MSNDCDQYLHACPTTDQLDAFSEGRLPESQLSAIAAHLETCCACTTILEGLRRSDAAVVAAVRGLPKWEEICSDPVFQQLQALGRAMPVFLDPLSDGLPSAGAEPSCSTNVEQGLDAPGTETWRTRESDQQQYRATESDRLLPEKIGGYFVLRVLGEGGFGVVYLAKDPKTDTTVAIKVPKAGPLVTEEGIQEFLREARTVGELQHPRIVHVRDFQRLPRHGCCIVMQYFEGGSLDKFLAQERVGCVRSAQWIADLADALHEVHRRKIYHRDIKPANVLLDSHGLPHLSDFGLALLDEDRWLHRDELAGTRAYMSPEQVRGQTQFMDSRTDIWGLGVILFEMLTRERPFRGRTAEEVSQEILHKQPNPRVINAEIPVELERICTKCLSKEPDQRYTNVLDLSADLRAWLTAQGTLPSPAVTAAGRDQAEALSESPDAPAAAKHRARYVVLLAVVVALIGVAAFFISDRYAPYRGPEDAPSQLLPDSMPLAESWLPLLGQEPVMVSWEMGNGRELPRFDKHDQRYTIRSDQSRWIARIKDLESRPMELRAALSVDNWVGFGGIVWGLRDDPEAFPDKRYRCLAVEYLCTGATKPTKLVAVEMFLTEHSFDDIRLEFTRTIDVQVIAPPKDREALLELTIESNRLRVRFDQKWDWEPVDLEEATNWLPGGRTVVGLTGQGRETAIRGLSYRYLPSTKE